MLKAPQPLSNFSRFSRFIKRISICLQTQTFYSFSNEFVFLITFFGKKAVLCKRNVSLLVCPVFLKSRIQALRYHYEIVPIGKMIHPNSVRGRSGGFTKFKYQNLPNTPKNVRALSTLVQNY